MVGPCDVETVRADARPVDFVSRDGTTSRESVPSCCRCGFCCLGERCQTAIDLCAFVGVTMPRAGRCPYLEFEPGANPQAGCALVRAGFHPSLFGFGVGCCCSARAARWEPAAGGVVRYRFAVLSDSEKCNLARLVESGAVPSIHTGAA